MFAFVVLELVLQRISLFKDIDREECLQNDLLYVVWDIKP